MTTDRLNDLSVRIPNRPGELARLATALGAAGVSLEGGGAFTSGDTALAHFLVEDGEAASAALRAVDIDTDAVSPVIRLRLKQDAPGQLGELAARMAAAGVNIEVQYSDHLNHAILVVDEHAKASIVAKAWDAEWWGTDDRAPTLTQGDLLLRPGRPADAPILHSIRSEESVARWWGQPEPVADIVAALRGDQEEIVLVVEADGVVAGAIQYAVIGDEAYAHTSIDLYLTAARQGEGIGTRAIALLADFLFTTGGHRRLTIDPAVTNTRAIRAYTKVGFQPVGAMRGYERAPDGTYFDNLLMDLLATDHRHPA